MPRVEYCSAYNCRSSKKNSPNQHFFRFPRDLKRAKLWMINVKRNDLLGKAYQNYKLCSLHFKDTQIDSAMSRYRLLGEAIPIPIGSSCFSADCSNTTTLSNNTDPLNTTDLPAIVDNTTEVPTIFNPVFVEIKQELNQITSYVEASHNQPGLYENMKCSNENNNENENWDFGAYEILDSPNVSDTDADIPMPKRIKLESSNSSSSYEARVAKQSVDINTTDDSIDEQISVPKITKVDLSKVSLKVVTVPTEKGTKIIVRTVAKSSQDQEASTSSENPAFDSQSDNSVIKVASKLAERTLKSKYIPKTNKNSQHIKFDHNNWKDEETQGLLNCIYTHRKEFKNLQRGDHQKFWEKMAMILKAQNVVKHSTTLFEIYNKWKTLSEVYKQLESYNTDIGKHPFMGDVKRILVDKTVVSNADKLKNRKTKNWSSNASNPSTSSKTNLWLDEDTRTFLNYIIDHIATFISNGFETLFWVQMETDLQKHGVMSRAATADQLRMKWKLLIEEYKFCQFDKVEQNQLPYIKEIKNILLNPLKPNLHSISIGLQSFYPTSNNSPESSNFQTVQDTSSRYNFSTNTIKLNKNLSTSELKRIYLEKKIAGQYLKYKLLTKLFSEPNSNIVPNKFTVVKNDCLIK